MIPPTSFQVAFKHSQALPSPTSPIQFSLFLTSSPLPRDALLLLVPDPFFLVLLLLPSLGHG